MVGHSIHPAAASVLKSLGGDASGFTARQLTPKVAAGAELILTMTKAHRDAVLELAPHRLNRTFTLSEASRLVTECSAQNIDDLATLRSHLSSDGVMDVRDPIGQSDDVFESVGAEIASLLPPILKLCRHD